ncbi:MAG TPA: winged helix-turn-helix domain-containing protein [Bryobacteraceae bacterium]|nr:winged helix-turn-helix domain-containing protein [Bryobacteraceae bacterium]
MSGDRGGRVFRFGVFEASEAAGELRKHGIRIKIHAQPFQVLIMLLERPAEIVTRDEMRQQLWGAGTFVDFDHALNTAVNKIREALDDSASSPRYVETVAGKGYRFIAPLGPAGLDLAPTSSETADAQLSPRADDSSGTILTAPDELPVASRKTVRTLLILVQAMYIGFYVGALANLAEIHDIFLEANLPPAMLMAVLITTGAALIPIRLYILTAVALDFEKLPSKFARMFPVLLVLDLLWALSPFLLIHHVSMGLALGMTAPLIYVPFVQRSLVLMYSRAR